MKDKATFAGIFFGLYYCLYCDIHTSVIHFQDPLSV